MKGILTNCNTGKKSIIDLEYEIVNHKGIRLFSLKNGVTGYESFCIDDFEGHTKVNTLVGLRKYGWRANVGTKGVWDELFISGEEMTKALEGVI